MPKDRSKKSSNVNPGLPCVGEDSPLAESAGGNFRDTSIGVFKATLEGVGQTIPLSNLEEPTLGEWLPGFSAPELRTESSLESLGDDQLLPAWAGSYAPDASASGENFDYLGYRPERVIGRDDRIQVTNTSQYPFRSICQLIITAKSGRRYLGTGWLGGNKILYTAGHCTYMRNEGGLASSITVYPGRNGSHQPFHSMQATNWGCSEAWAEQGTQSSDIGCVFVGDDCSALGRLGFDHPYSESQLKQLKLHIIGYPADKPTGTMWGHSNQLIRVYERQLAYAIDTMGGESGAAVSTGDGMVVGIHNYGGNSGNLASRITPEVKSMMTRWWEMSGSTS